MTLFLDSDVLIDFLRGDDAAVRFVEGAMRSQELLATTCLNAAEVLRGEARPRRRRAAEVLLGELREHAFDRAAARRYAVVASGLDAVGRPVPAMDAMIASIALENGGTLATRNGRHFRRVSGLDIVEP